MSSLQISVIMPVWNRWDLTSACLESLRRFTPGNFMEVIVVDNGSDDATSTALKPLGQRLFGNNFRLLRQESNLGFAAACNIGAHAASAPMLFFLNNDTILSANWLAPLLTAMRQTPNLGAVGPLLLYPEEDRVQHLGVAFTPTLAAEHLYSCFPAKHPVVSVSRPLQAITGAAILIPKELFLAAGAFHEGYRNGGEDLELCSRLTDLGKRVTIAPQSRIIHLESQTPGRATYDKENFKLLNERCHGRFTPDIHKLVKRDGFTLGLTPTLETFVCLPPTREEELSLEYIQPGAPQPGLWLDKLQDEPLWREGYEALANYLEKESSFEASVGVRLLSAYFFPLLPNYKALAKAAAMAGNDKLVEQTTLKIGHIAEALNDADGLINKATTLARWAKQVGDSDLELLYTGWLRSLGLEATE